jgi:hypothetical protein
VIEDALVSATGDIYGWIEEVFGRGVRLPGYPADRWAEDWLQKRFRAAGLERVRAEPVTLPYWEPREASLTIVHDGSETMLPCFALPHCARVRELEADVVEGDGAPGAIALREIPLMRVPFGYYEHVATWHYDPDGTFAEASQVLPFGRELQHVMEPAIAAGAVGFIGVLSGHPGDSRDYYVPYDGIERAIPGVWIRGSDGARLRSLVAGGAVRARITVDAVRETITSYNIVGELPGADDETVIVGSHHDGPWASAVEDASGIALVLAQVAYWSRLPRERRPHRLVFLLNCGHMAGGAGQATFVREHRSELDRTVLAVHLEHVAAHYSERDGRLQASGEPEARWWFTSRINRLEAAVREAIEAEHVTRSLILRPDIFGEKPTTDGADFYPAGVPIAQHLAAPFYLFDAMDTMDKIHRPSLVPVTRAAIRIINTTAGVSAAAMRADTVRPDPVNEPVL